MNLKGKLIEIQIQVIQIIN